MLLIENMKFKKIAVKIGSNVLTRADGTLDITRMSALVDQIAVLHKKGVEIVLISSGAVASGRSILGLNKKMDVVDQRQLYSAVGQAKLINHYWDLFRDHSITVGQVLTTKENFSSRRHYLNQRNCMQVMLDNNVIPIVNENDTVSVSELMFTDNDELSGLIASMMDMQALIILSNIDGIYNGSPADPASTVIRQIEKGQDITDFIQTTKSTFGRGGMATKTSIARKIADEVSSVKKWIAHSEGFAKGELHVNQNAAKALLGERAVSLLPVGVTRVVGEFEKDDIVKIMDESGQSLGVGKVQYDSVKAREIIGKKNQKPLVHCDYLYLE
jgi:glutamate 5-kinase